MTQTMMFMPLVFGYIAFTFPQGAVLYWVVSSLVGIVQQYFTSGWGSLANYLKFLPPDGKPVAGPNTLTPVAVGAEVGVAASPSARADFWGVMRPLTELKEPGTVIDGSVAKDAPSLEDANDEARTQGRETDNPRRPRKRK